MSTWLCILLLGIMIPGGLSISKHKQVDDKFRPQIHFSIPEFWINDPNGMVYLDGEFHLFYQYYPGGTDWGPMHWGHSISTDLVSWTHLPIALYPDDLGLIFSGSAVADFANSSGLQQGDKTTIVAIFTHSGESQQQSIAYSNDNGRNFTKFSGNPVIPNPGIPDFRDPKVIPYEDHWIMVLAAGNKVMFYKSMDLKSWEFLSEFGNEPSQGAHSGVWECPDLLKMSFGSDTVWVLLVSINPGGPNSGSNTQYFIGDFNGRTFSSSQINPLWMDWGTDNYAGVTFANDPEGRNILMAWMSNWAYASSLPTNGWKGQMTLPRQLDIVFVEGKLRLKSFLSKEVEILNKAEELFEINTVTEIPHGSVLNLTEGLGWKNPLIYLDVNFSTTGFKDDSNVAICFLNPIGQEVCAGYDKGQDLQIFVDRSKSGNTGFNSAFSTHATASREKSDPNIRFQIYLDISALELFVDSGLTCMTSLFYPDEPFTTVQIRHSSNQSDSKLTLISARLQGLKSMNDAF